jgi:hypothetical protein
LHAVASHRHAPWRCSSSPITRTLSSGSSSPCSSSIPARAPIARTVGTLSPESSAVRMTPGRAQRAHRLGRRSRARWSAAAITPQAAAASHDHRGLRLAANRRTSVDRRLRRGAMPSAANSSGVPISMRVPASHGDQALAEVVRERSRRRPRRPRDSASRTTACASGMRRALLGARRPAEQLALRGPCHRDHIRDLEAAVRERAGLVERHRLTRPRASMNAPPLNRMPLRARVRDRRQHRGRGGDHERARRGDHEQRHGAIERCAPLVPEHERRQHSMSAAAIMTATV